jgi:hypothetical protein
MWPLLRAQGNCGIKNFVARSDPAKAVRVWIKVR